MITNRGNKTEEALTRISRHFDSRLNSAVERRWVYFDENDDIHLEFGSNGPEIPIGDKVLP